MDVQAATATASVLPSPLPPPVTPGSSASPSAAGAIPAPPPPVPATSKSDSGSSNANPQIGVLPGFASLPPSQPENIKEHPAEPTVTSGVAKFFNTAEQNVSVSFQVAGPNEIVTVFTNKTTGKVIVQFPSETLIALGKFFDKLDGSVVNKKV